MPTGRTQTQAEFPCSPNNIDNQGAGSFTDVLAGTGHNHIRGLFGIG
jgi:hypothetical protein